MNTVNKLVQENLFIVLGGHKCGTTSLHQYLGQHPEIIMPQFKGEDILKKPNLSLEQYYNQYVNIGNKTFLGEVSSAYLYSKKACQNIKQYFPEAKLIAILRNPFERAFSNFNDLAEDHPLKQRCSFEEICKNPSDFLDEGVVNLGLYSSSIKIYLEHFNREQICVLLFDDFVKNKSKFYSSLFEFVGVDPCFIPDTSVILRKGGKTGIKNKAIKKILLDENSWFRSMIGGMIKPFTTPDQRRLIFLKTRNLFIKRESSSSLSTELKQNLINFYREDVLRTQELLQVNLSHWL